jgi:hypothetical protein
MAIFLCFGGAGILLVACCCVCVYAGEIAERLSVEFTSLVRCCWDAAAQALLLSISEAKDDVHGGRSER